MNKYFSIFWEDADIDIYADIPINEEIIKALNLSPWAVSFDCSTSRNWRTNCFINVQFLGSVEDYMNQRLRKEGYITLNDVRDALGLKKIEKGYEYGWVYNGETNKVIDFGIVNELNFWAIVRKEMYHEFILDFNVTKLK